MSPSAILVIVMTSLRSPQPSEGYMAIGRCSVTSGTKRLKDLRYNSFFKVFGMLFIQSQHLLQPVQIS